MLQLGAIRRGAMRVVTVTSQKGGSGKTTLVRNLAVAAGDSTMVVDSDPQGSLSSWWNRRAAETPRLAQITADNAGEVLDRLRDAGVKLVIVDTPPSVHPFVGDLVRYSDLVLIPVRPSPDDLGAITPTIEIVEAAAKPFAFVLSQVKPRTRLAVEALRVLAEHGKVAPAVLHDRTEYATAAIGGLGVTEADPDGKAAAEVSDLLAYVSKQLRGKHAA